MALLNEFLDFIDDGIKWICIVLVALMTGVVLLQVFVRILPITAPSWTEELSRYILIYLSFLGASHGIKVWNNIRVDFILTRLPKKAELIAETIIKLIVLGVLCTVAVLGIKIFPMVGLKQYSATLQIPMFYMQLSIIIGTILSSIQLIGLLINNIVQRGENNV